MRKPSVAVLQEYIPSVIVLRQCLRNRGAEVNFVVIGARVERGEKKHHFWHFLWMPGRKETNSQGTRDHILRFVFFFLNTSMKLII